MIINLKEIKNQYRIPVTWQFFLTEGSCLQKPCGFPEQQRRFVVIMWTAPQAWSKIRQKGMPASSKDTCSCPDHFCIQPTDCFSQKMDAARFFFFCTDNLSENLERISFPLWSQENDSKQHGLVRIIFTRNVGWGEGMGLESEQWSGGMGWWAIWRWGVAPRAGRQGL